MGDPSDLSDRQRELIDEEVVLEIHTTRKDLFGILTMLETSGKAQAVAFGNVAPARVVDTIVDQILEADAEAVDELRPGVGGTIGIGEEDVRDRFHVDVRPVDRDGGRGGDDG